MGDRALCNCCLSSTGCSNPSCLVPNALENKHLKRRRIISILKIIQVVEIERDHG